MPVRAVLFDATGTLFELAEPVGESYARLAAEHGVKLPAWRIEDAFRRILARSEPRIFPDAGVSEVASCERAWWYGVVRATFRAADQTVVFDDFDGFFAALYDFYAGAGAWRLRPGVRETLATLRARGLRLGVVSDFDHRLTQVLECLGIMDFFEVVVRAGDVGTAKPEARPFEAALERLGVAAHEAVYVGDDASRDRDGARRLGLGFLDARDLAELPARLANV